jgi:hypothetical protein
MSPGRECDGERQCLLRHVPLTADGLTSSANDHADANRAKLANRESIDANAETSAQMGEPGTDRVVLISRS